MRFVVDENVSFAVVERLQAQGHTVVSIAKEHSSLADEEVYKKAATQKAVLVTRDHHFTNPLRFPPENTGGIIYIRHGKLNSEEEAALVTSFLESYGSVEMQGSLVTLSKERATIRPPKKGR